jgi:hypothetical protein
VLLVQTFSARDSFEIFHESLLKRFIPARQLSQLRVGRYERVQADNEPLGSYIQSITDAALVLRITKAEPQFVERIIEGLTANQRARFEFQGPPKSFKQLEHLVVVDRIITFADNTRQPVAVDRRHEVVQSTVRNDTVNCPLHPSSKTPDRVNVPVCYHYGKSGHIQRKLFR